MTTLTPPTKRCEGVFEPRSDHAPDCPTRHEPDALSKLERLIHEREGKERSGVEGPDGFAARAMGLIAEARDERAELEADNAALLSGLSVCGRIGLTRESLGDPVAAEYARALVAQPHPGATLLEAHARALVRARNDGLEKARRMAHNVGLRNLASLIDAAKESEP
jgi:hypothetical protein